MNKSLSTRKKPLTSSSFRQSFELDPYNRLVETTINRRASIVGMRRVLDGYFVAGKDSLRYILKQPVPFGRKSVSDYTFKGSWSLGEEEELIFTLDGWQNQIAGERLVFKGEIVQAGANSFVYSVGTRTASGKTSIYLLNLGGRWRLNSDNFLTFEVKQEKKNNHKPDELILQGAWELDKNYRIVYQHKEIKGKTKKKNVEGLIFEGSWQITEKEKLSYVLSYATNSCFDFKARLLKIDKRKIEFQLGVGFSSLKDGQRYKKITFFGSWDFSRKLGIFFEIPLKQGRPLYFCFGAEARLTEANSILCDLRIAPDKPLGWQIELSQKVFANEGRIFLRLLKEREKAVFLGLGFSW